jgi:cytochrome c oxidase subunit 1
MNMLATVGAFTLGLGVLVFAWNLIRSYRRGDVAGDDPWGGETLEWSTPSPPPRYSWVYPPTARGRSPMWENPPDAPVVTGLKTDTRQMLCTTTLDAVPHHRYSIHGDAIAPLLLACAVVVTLDVGGVFHPFGAVVGTAMAAAVLFGWFWMSGERKPTE